MKRNISEHIKAFRVKQENINHRYYSFDFCYAHFRQSKENGKIDIEKSCYVLWSYLASWGMLRGSTLLWKNPTYLKPLVEWIYKNNKEIWYIDVEDYQDKYGKIISLYDEVKDLLTGKDLEPTLTLITKVMLGVFAIVPAYDRFFKETFNEIAKSSEKKCNFNSLKKLNEQSLDVICQFYLANQEEIDHLSQSFMVKDFNGENTGYHYSQAKIIDMYGFQIGLEKYNSKKQSS